MIWVMAGAAGCIVFFAMKPSIPDMGTVVRVDGESAVVRMKHDGSCSKCGAAAIGLCKGGLMQELTVRNPERARVGDTVRIGLVRGVQYRGFVMAYAVPAAALILGIAGGHVLAAAAGVPALDIIGGFTSMVTASFFSLRRLKRLDSSHAIEIVTVVGVPWVPASPGSDQGTVPDHCISAC